MPFISTIKFAFTHFCVEGYVLSLQHVLNRMINLIYPRICGLLEPKPGEEHIVNLPVLYPRNVCNIIVVWVCLSNKIGDLGNSSE